MTKEQALSECTVEGNVVKLPEVQLEPAVYSEVKKALSGIGGKWKGGEVSGFVFNADPTELLTRIQNGEVVNLKKEYQFFGTPFSIARDMAEMSFYHCNCDEVIEILEPSAGQGALLEALQEYYPEDNVTCIELMDTNVKVLQKKGYDPIQEDFLTWDSQGKKFDLIIANPPFSKNQDIDHIMKMWDLLKHDGEIVTLASCHWMDSTKAKEVEFKKFIEEKAVYCNILPAGAFKESGTNIAVSFLVLRKTAY